jgi:rsbT co-antagonist protein RsbR
MPASSDTQLAGIIDAQEQQILHDWLERLRQRGALTSGRIKESELSTQAKAFFSQLRAAVRESGVDVQSAGYESVKAYLAEISRSRAFKGFSPSETAMFVFSLKRPLFDAAAKEGSAAALQRAWDISQLVDELGLYTMEVYQKSREDIIIRQQRELAELSTPVVKLWDGILALPLIGTLDSARTQVVMENLLQSIVDYGAQISVIDITGVPTVDTLVAQHLLKTVAAARLMGADCIISGIRPQIAQTMVHLGVDLDVVTKASLADAFAVALQRMGRTVADLDAASEPARGS